jgi:hypothetical protein
MRRVECLCRQCAKPFSLVPSQVEKGRGKLCSLTCARIANLRQPVSIEQRRATSNRANKAYAKRHPDRVRLRHFIWRLSRYKLTLEDYERMVADGCAICKSHEPGGTRNKRFHLDHDHSTGRFRGFLCGPCNVTLGVFKDDPTRLRRAAEYLERHQRKADVA